MTNYICSDLYKTIIEFVPLADLKYLHAASPIFDKLIKETEVDIVYGYKYPMILRPEKDIVIRTAGNVLRVIWPGYNRYKSTKKVTYLHCTNEHNAIVGLAKKYTKANSDTVWIKMIGSLYTIVEKPPKKIHTQPFRDISTLVSVSFCEISHKSLVYIDMNNNYLVQDTQCSAICQRKIVVTEFKVLYEGGQWK